VEEAARIGVGLVDIGDHVHWCRQEAIQLLREIVEQKRHARAQLGRATSVPQPP